MIILPWEKRTFILNAEANLRAAFDRHREVMIVGLSRKLSMDPQEVRDVLASAEPKPKPPEPPKKATTAVRAKPAEAPMPPPPAMPPPPPLPDRPRLAPLTVAPRRAP